MRLSTFLFTVVLGLAAHPASATVTVVGNSLARTCFEAAEAEAPPGRTALDRCDRALAQDALTEYDRVATHVNRGLVRLRVGQVPEAIQDFDAAIARNPNQAEAYLSKGMALLRLEADPRQAADLFSKALEKGTRRPEMAYYGRGVAHELSGRIRPAYFDYKQASILDPLWQDPKQELTRFVVRGK